MDPSDLKRLSFIKYLFTLAINQSQLPEPAGAAAILTFHDAVELFNQLACEHLDIDTVGRGSKQTSFIEYWDLISAKLPQPLPQKESMNRLNRGRVALKHHGSLPANLDIESHRANVTPDLGKIELVRAQGKKFAMQTFAVYLPQLRGRRQTLCASEYQVSQYDCAIEYLQAKVWESFDSR